MFTSQLPAVHGVTRTNVSLDRNKITLPELLKNNGYMTVANVGGSPVSFRYGFFKGFTGWHEPVENDKSIIVEDYKEFGTSIDRSINWLENNRSSSFFMFLHTFDVHHAHSLQYEPKYGYNIGLSAEEKLKNVEKYYGEALKQADSQIKKLIDKLKELGIYDNTVIILTSDHGVYMDEREDIDHANLHTHSYTLYDEELRVPLIIGNLDTDGRRVFDDYVESIDIMPAILDYLGMEIPDYAQGVSLIPLINGKMPSLERTLFCESRLGLDLSRELAQVSVRLKDYKYFYTKNTDLVKESNAKFRGGERALFNLKTDQQEKNNIAVKEKDLTMYLQKMVDSYLTSPDNVDENTLNKNKISLSPAELKRLKALGYIK